jgi:hypothetical protein
MTIFITPSIGCCISAGSQYTNLSLPPSISPKSAGFEKNLMVRSEPEHFKLLRDLSDLDLPFKKLDLDLARSETGSFAAKMTQFKLDLDAAKMTQVHDKHLE